MMNFMAPNRTLNISSHDACFTQAVKNTCNPNLVELTRVTVMSISITRKFEKHNVESGWSYRTQSQRVYASVGDWKFGIKII